jgi:methionyl aminopeptidase
MITIKNKIAIEKMYTAGQHLADLFSQLEMLVKHDISTLSLDTHIEAFIKSKGMVSETKGYAGYCYASCISVNDELVHGIPSSKKIVKEGDLVKIDVCASWKGYCADMARPFIVTSDKSGSLERMIEVSKLSLNAGISNAIVGNRLFDISAAIGSTLDHYGYGIVRDFVGHGIGRSMHEEPDVPNYGVAGTGPKLVSGMAFAIEPMFTQKGYAVFVDSDKWTVKTNDASIAMHREDTVVITQGEPLVITRHCSL